MPADHASDAIEEIINRILTGRENHGTVIDAVCNQDRSYFRNAIAPVVARLEDDRDAAIRQRNKAEMVKAKLLTRIEVFAAECKLG